MSGTCPVEAGNVEVMRIAGGLHPNHIGSRYADYADANGRVGGSRQRIGIEKGFRIDTGAGIGEARDDFAARSAEVVGECVPLYAGSVELEESDSVAVGTPLEAIADVKFLLVDPVGRAVDDVFGTVAGELADFS